MRTIEQMIQQEINCCMSSLVSTLAQAFHNDNARMVGGSPAAWREMRDIMEQAFELASPIPDYEEAAIQAGWEEQPREPEGQHVFIDKTDGQTWCAADWEALCRDYGIEPYDREVYEHWAVSTWFADKLRAAGEKVDDDFGGLCIWARTTTGQAISADGVVERIYADCHRPEACFSIFEKVQS